MTKIKKLLRNIINFYKFKKIETQIKFLSELDDIEFSFLDIGARGGIATAEKRFLLFKYFKKFYTVGIEPDPEDCARISNQYDEIFPIAVYEEKSTQKLYITKNPACASLFRPNASYLKYSTKREHLEIIEEVDVNVDRVDAVVKNRNFDLVKTDVQGATLEVLKGTGEILDNALICYLDVYFEELYENIKLFSDVDKFMRNKGYRMVSLSPVFSDGFVVQSNITYIRISESMSKDSLIKLLSIACILENKQLKLHLLENFSKNLLDMEEYKAVLKKLRINKQKRGKRWNDSDWKGLTT